MSEVIELFGRAHDDPLADWKSVVRSQTCPYLQRRCYKIRKSDPTVSIGTCTVAYGSPPSPVIICPTRLIEAGQIFTDCLHLLTTHEPGNELHLLREVAVPGGSVDYVLASVRENKVRDFVGIELQTLDTTGSVWPARQRLLRELNIRRRQAGEDLDTTYGMNWKMTAKTILVQMHHKSQTFEHVNKRLVLVMQDRLLIYMKGQFRFDHLNNSAALGDPVHFHAYRVNRAPDGNLRLALADRLSTDADGVGQCLGLQGEARIELTQIVAALEAKISPNTRFRPALG